MRSCLPRPIVAAILAWGVVVATPGAASAAPVAINGSPLTVYVGPQGQLQGSLADASRIYYSPLEELGDAGFFLAFPTAGAGPAELNGHVWGFEGSAGPHGLDEYVNTAQKPVTGSGSAADPFSQLTEYKAVGGTDGVYVAQTTTYANGAQQFGAKWVVTNKTEKPLNFRALAAADFYFEGDDRGTGIFTLGPPRFVGGVNVDSGRSGGFVEVNDGISPPWSHYQELAFPAVWTEVVERAAEPIPSGFDDTVDANDVDNAGGVEWDQYREAVLPAGASATFELLARTGQPAALQLNPTNAAAPQGVPIAISATAVDSNGAPYAGQALRYAITGANPGSGVVTLDGSGTAVVTDPGTNAGGDTVAVFVDFNGDGVRQAAEPQASALTTFVDQVPPRCTIKIRGDRPGGSGGAGRPLMITVDCSETSSVTVNATLIAPAAANGSSAVTRRRQGAGKRVKFRLPSTKAEIPPGASTALRIKVPKKIARRYAGSKLTAKIVATVMDGAGNRSKAKKTAKVRISGRG
jgi:hypothetical protein